MERKEFKSYNEAMQFIKNNNIQVRDWKFLGKGRVVIYYFA